MGGPNAALAIAQRSGKANVGIMMDTFHYYLSQVQDADILAIPPEKLFIVHVNDSKDLPIPELKDKHRVHLGQGILPLDHDLGLRKQLGYDSFLSIEIFNEDYWQLPLDEVVGDAKTSIDSWLNRNA